MKIYNLFFNGRRSISMLSALSLTQIYLLEEFLGGFYKVSYVDHENITRYTATTQFQATSARNAFPCFDEPVYKATFAYNLTYPAELNAWTNTPRVGNVTLE